MRKALIIAAMAFCACAAVAVPKIAVLTPTMDKSVDPDIGSAIVDKILEQLLRSRKFNIVDRSSRDVVWEERNFQLSSGEIDQKEIKNIGKGLGADYVVVVKVKKVGTLFSMSVTMIDVETLEVVATATAESKASVENLLELAAKCGAQIVEEDYESGGIADKFVEDEEEEAEDVAVKGGSGSQDADYYQLKNDVRSMLRQKVYMKSAGQARIAQKAGALDLRDRHSLYDEFSKGTALSVVGMFLNMVPFVKVGSFLQGDVSGALNLGVWEAISFIVMMVAASDEVDSLDLFTIGTLSYTFFYVFSWFQPYIYQAGHNKNLSKSLNVVALGPSPRPEVRMAEGGGKAGIRATLVSFRY